MAPKSKKLSISTQEIYERHAASLSKQSKAHLKKTKLSFFELAQGFIIQDYKWKQNTIIAYRNALLMKAREHLNVDKLSEFERIIVAGPRPHRLKLKTVSGRSTKRKNISLPEWTRFQKVALESNDDWDRFIVSFLKFGLMVPCRPIEMGSMCLVGDELFIQTAKSNLIRGLKCEIPINITTEILIHQINSPEGFKFRSIGLERLEARDRLTIKFVCEVIRDWVKVKGGWPRFYDALRARCRVLSARARVAPAISPSSVRHLAISAIKSASGIKAAAAAAGHANTKSAVNGYKHASRKSLEISNAHLAEPNKKALNLVRVNKNTFHPRVRKLQLAQDQMLLSMETNKTEIKTSEGIRPTFDKKENIRRLLEALSKPHQTAPSTADTLTTTLKSETAQAEIETATERPAYRKP